MPLLVGVAGKAQGDLFGAAHGAGGDGEKGGGGDVVGANHAFFAGARVSLLHVGGDEAWVDEGDFDAVVPQVVVGAQTKAAQAWGWELIPGDVSRRGAGGRAAGAGT